MTKKNYIVENYFLIQIMVDQIGLGPCETGFTHRTSSPQQSCKALRSFMAQQSTDLAEEKNMKLSPLLFVGMNLNKKMESKPTTWFVVLEFRLPRCLSFLSKSIDVQTFLVVPLSQITSSTFQNIPTGHMGAGIVPTPTGQTDSSVHLEFTTQVSRVQPGNCNCDITKPSATRPCSVLCYAMVPPSGASGASSCDTTWLLSGK